MNSVWLVLILSSGALPRRKAVIQGPVDSLSYQGMAQGPLVLIRRIFVLLCIVEIEGGLKAG
jgi:hypothetical protein